MRVDINGNELYVEVLGPDDVPTLITHHGAPGLADHTETKAGFGALADEFRVVVFDARGCGRSEGSGLFTNAQWAADVDGLREWLGCERVCVAGGSYGGFIAMEYAFRYPDRAAAIVLRDTTADGARMREVGWEHAEASDRTSIDRVTWDRLMSGGLRSDEDLAEIWRDLLPLYDFDFDFDPATLDAKVAATPFRYRTQNAALVNIGSYDMKPWLPEIRCPALVIVGRHDWLAPPELAQQMADLIPDARLEVFERSGHAPELEEPDRFVRVVRAFLRSATR